MSVSAVNLTPIYDSRPLSPSFSFPSRLIENIWNAFVETIRFDRSFVSSSILLSTGAFVYVLGPLFGIYTLAINILFLGAIKTFKESSYRSLLKRLDLTPFPLSNVIRNIAIGAIAYFPLSYLIENATELCVWALEQLGIAFTQSQDVALLVSSPMLGILFSLIAVILAPIAEELLFRGNINDLFLLSSHDAKNPSNSDLSIKELHKKKAFSAWDKAVTILKTSLIFAAVHMSPFQSWTNIPIFLATFLVGLSAGILREVTGDLWAPAIFHGINNARAVYQIRFA